MCSAIQSDDDNHNDGFDEDMEALRRACTLAATNLNDFHDIYSRTNNTCSALAEVEEEEEADRDSYVSEEADLELFRSIQNRFSITNVSSEPLSSEPLYAIPPDFDNEDDDFETLCAVRRRFAAYDTSDVNVRKTEKAEGFEAVSVVSEVETLSDSFTGANNCKSLNDKMEMQSCASIGQHQLDSFNLSSLGLKSSSSFPNSAQLFMDAIKRNRSCQKFLQSKLTQIEARMEENKKLKERVKILRDFQVSCRKITGRALGQGKDPRIQLISAQKTLNSRDAKVNGKKISALYDGPVENSHVANYRMALRNFPLLLKQRKWTEAEKENLKKGIRQQFQEMVLQFSADQFSVLEVSPGNANNVDAILASIRDLEIAPERCREFLPKVNWDQLASLYVVGRTGAECEAQWLNIEDPLINHGEWTVEEDKKLLFIVQEKGMTNWFDIAVSLGKNRTPFQCLARFQRSLNAHIIKNEWTKEEDAQLRAAVETFGENDWQSVASTLEGRTGPQCSNRWKKSLHPDIYRVGRWNLEESTRLKVAVMLFGPKNWKKIAQFVPGRSHVKCRERWFNCVDPSLKMDKWTADEDIRLKAAIEEFGYCWAKVAKCLAPRTDNQCRRRWKVLFPHEVPLLQAARKTQKAATISNFVDRESERPALGPHDFVLRPIIQSPTEPEDVNESRKHKRKTREGAVSGKDKNAAPGNTSKRLLSKRPKGKMQISSSEDLEKTNAAEEISGGDDSVNGVMLPTERSESRVIGTENSNSSLDGISLSNVKKVHKCTRKHGTKASGKGQRVASILSRYGGQKISGQRSFSQQVIDSNNEGDVTLASLMQNKSQKRSRQVNKNADWTCCPSDMKTGSELVPKRFDQHNKGNKMPSVVQDGEAEVCENNGIPENASSCGRRSYSSVRMQGTGENNKEPLVQDTVRCRTNYYCGSVREHLSINCDDLDITLASLLRKKKREKGQVLLKNEQGT